MFSIFESVTWAKAARKDYKIGPLTNGVITDLEDVWGEVPAKFRVHQGDVVIDDHASFGVGEEEDNNLYVIAGDLTVKGSLRIRQGDTLAILYVTGSVTCADCFLEIEGSLIVGGSLTAKRLLVTELSDQGLLVVHGELAAKVWLEARGRGFIDFEKLKCPNPLFSGDPAHYRAAGRGKEAGEVAYLFDVKAAKNATTMLAPKFFKGGEARAEAVINGARKGEEVFLK